MGAPIKCRSLPRTHHGGGRASHETDVQIRNTDIYFDVWIGLHVTGVRQPPQHVTIIRRCARQADGPDSPVDEHRNDGSRDLRAVSAVLESNSARDRRDVQRPDRTIFIDEDRCWHVAEADMRMLMGMIDGRTWRGVGRNSVPSVGHVRPTSLH